MIVAGAGKDKDDSPVFEGGEPAVYNAEAHEDVAAGTVLNKKTGEQVDAGHDVVPATTELEQEERELWGGDKNGAAAEQEIQEMQAGEATSLLSSSAAGSSSSSAAGSGSGSGASSSWLPSWLQPA